MHSFTLPHIFAFIKRSSMRSVYTEKRISHSLGPLTQIYIDLRER
jgi:hypothetical protein